MSYISNLVQRTLGTTPVVQPVIQAKFAPPGPGFVATHQEPASEKTAAAVRDPNRISAPQENAAARLVPVPSPTPTDGSVRNILVHQVLEHVAANSSPTSAELGMAQRAEGRAVARVPPNSESATRPQGLLHPLPEDIDTHDGFRLMSPESHVVARPGVINSALAQPRSTISEFREAPVVRVHIGRVDVRMVQQNTKEPRTAPPTAFEARPTSLEDYLRDKLRGQR